MIGKPRPFLFEGMASLYCRQGIC